MDITPSPAEKALIERHLDSDVRSLALRIRPADGIRPQYVLQQIAGHQAMRRKVPLWADTAGIVYPVHLSVEQCSSADTARYKRGIVERICAGRVTFADLTAGFGVDFHAMSEGFGKAYYIERNAELCEMAAHNLRLLGRSNFSVLNMDGLDFVRDSGLGFDCFFLDPARRDSHGGKTVHIEDCEPNVAEYQDLLLEKAKCVIIKLSPMLDISECRLRLRNISEIHIVGSAGECKEVLLVLMRGADVGEPTIYAAGSDGVISFSKSSEMALAVASVPEVIPGQYLYEPNAAIMKAGCYKTVARMFGLSPVHPNSHLYVGDGIVEDFPGRRFRIERMGSPKDFRDLRKANIAVRNFPMRADDLRKKMRLQDGGDVYLFATTIAGDRKVLLECRKV